MVNLYDIIIHTMYSIMFNRFNIILLFSLVTFCLQSIYFVILKKVKSVHVYIIKVYTVRTRHIQ